MNIVPLPAPTDITPTIVETLEALLDAAKQGDMQNFIFVAITRDGGCTAARSFEPGSPRYALIGAVENRLRALHELLEREEQSETVFSPEQA